MNYQAHCKNLTGDQSPFSPTNQQNLEPPFKVAKPQPDERRGKGKSITIFGISLNVE